MPTLRKIIELIKKTGGKYILSDEKGEATCVVLSMEDYEQILAKNNDNYGNRLKVLTDSEMLAKINADIAFWKESQKPQELEDLAEDFIDKKGYPNDLDFGENSGELDEEDRYYLEPID